MEKPKEKALLKLRDSVIPNAEALKRKIMRVADDRKNGLDDYERRWLWEATGDIGDAKALLLRVLAANRMKLPGEL